MKKANLRAECTMLDDEASEARAAATELADKVDVWKRAYEAQTEWAKDLAGDVTALAKENYRLKQAIRLLSKSL